MRFSFARVDGRGPADIAIVLLAQCKRSRLVTSQAGPTYAGDPVEIERPRAAS